MLLTSSGERPEASRAIGVNSRYSFELRQEPGKKWVLVDYHEVGSEPREVFPHLGTQSPISRGLAPYWLDEGVWLPDLFLRDGKDAVLGPITLIVQNSETLVRVAFEYPHRHSPGISFKGHVDLNPKRFVGRDPMGQ